MERACSLLFPNLNGTGHAKDDTFSCSHLPERNLDSSRRNAMRLIIISNRVPVPSDDDQAGGLAVALGDALSERGGVWLGWDGEDPAPRASAPTTVHAGGVDFATLPLSEADIEDYYYGYANSVLWPLLHERLDAVDHSTRARAAYLSVNAYFADRAVEVLRPDDVIWVQDYHLIPLGRELRRRGTRGPMGFFLHTPFPPFDLFRALPRSTELVEDFFAYDLVGLQTSIDRDQFGEVLRHYGADVDEDRGVAELGPRRLRFGAFPIGIDVERTAEIAAANRESEASLRLSRSEGDRKLVIGADRLDYTKGLVKRLDAFDRFLDQHQERMDDQIVYIQIAAPSRESVTEYQAMMERLATEAGRINGRQNQIGWTPFRLMARTVPRPELLGYLSLADVGLVTPVRDGMNLVAKEFLAAQPEEDPGVLVLSKLAGAVEELSEAAVVVNPYDADGVAAGLHRALTLPLEERRRMWRTGMEALKANTARAWRRRFLDALTEGDVDGPVRPVVS